MGVEGSHGNIRRTSFSARRGIRTRTENERRKRMRNMFSRLHSLLPNFPHQYQRVDKPTIVEEAVKHIKTLQATLQSLQKKKRETLMNQPPSFLIQQTHQHLNLSLAITEPLQTLPPITPPALSNNNNKFQTFVSQNVVMCVAGENAEISVFCPTNKKRPCVLLTVAFMLDKFQLEFISARISTVDHLSTYMIHARRASGCSNDGASEEMKATETAFTMAAGEIASLLVAP